VQQGDAQTQEELPPVAGVRHCFVKAAGIEFHVAEAGSGEPLVLLHGWPQHWYMWRQQIPAFAQRHHVICVDLPGFGWSGVKDHGYEKEALAADVVSLDAVDARTTASKNLALTPRRDPMSGRPMGPVIGVDWFGAAVRPDMAGCREWALFAQSGSWWASRSPRRSTLGRDREGEQPAKKGRSALRSKTDDQ
jgi:hypothetical protein